MELATMQAERRTRAWRLDLGAEPVEGGVRFRVWAPKRSRVEVALDDGRSFELEPEAGGYYSSIVPVEKGARYRYRLDGEGAYPDPCSRFQPEGPHGPSAVVDPAEFVWTDAAWKGAGMPGQVIYELHVGAFTREGTFDAVIEELDELRRLGVTLIELMPVAEFPGRWNWGYDGVGLYAPSHVYGGPDGLKRLVNAAHARGLGVILDVVYNHLGPDGNYLAAFSDDYFTSRYRTDWGPAINYDGEQSGEVREFFIRNAAYWVREFHLDGLRLDATQNIYDRSGRHVLSEISVRAREAALPRKIVLIAENEAQDMTLVRPVESGGYGLDAMWNDDFHHAAHVALTGRREAYYSDYAGRPQEFVSLAKRGTLFQGQYYAWQKQNRGTAVGSEPSSAFVTYLENHDQTANSFTGRRIQALTSPGRYRALAALTFLSGQTPLIFMGQEFAASQPFLFFADHHAELAPKVFEGRKDFLSQFASCFFMDSMDIVDDPAAEATFEKCKLDFSERRTHGQAYALHHDLLHLRRGDPVLAAADRSSLDGAVLGESAFVLRFFDEGGDDRLLVVNLGRDFNFEPAAEPLLAPGTHRMWDLVWSSEDVRYGGSGRMNPCGKNGWRLSAESAVLLRSIPTLHERSLHP